MSGRGRTFLLQGQGDVTTSTAVGGTTNTVAKFTSPFKIGDSSITDDGTAVSISTALGIGTATPTGQFTVYGTGQDDASFSNSGAEGATLFVNSNNNNAGSGGGISLGFSVSQSANIPGFAGIKALLTSGAGNGVGDLAFSLRAAAGNAALTEQFRITSAGVILPAADNTIVLGSGTRGFKQVYAAYTDISASVTGSTTINKMAGSVNFAAAMTTVVVTNSVVTTSSKIFASISTSGSTGVIGSIVPASGSFAINMTTAPGAETRVHWFVLSAN